MSPRFPHVVLCAVTGSLLLAGCQREPSSSSSSPPVASVPSASSAAAGEGLVLRARGLTVTVPEGWTRVDPAADASEVVKGSWAITGNPFGDVLKDLLKELKDKGAVWALDPGSVSGTFATHLSAACDSGGLTGSDLESLRRKARLKAGAKVEDTTVSGRPALRISSSDVREYDRVAYETVEVRVPVSGDEFCYVSLEGLPGRLTPAVTGPILGSFTLD